jgi:4'-phosphopantetheinyl transferase
MIMVQLKQNSSIPWLTRKLSDCPGHNNWLGKQEKAVLDNLRFTKRRSDWRLGRWTAKQVIKNFLISESEDISFSRIEILADPDGAPKVYLKNKPALFTISISHSHGRAFCALAPSNKPIGCDIEFIEPRDENFICDYFTTEEMAWVKSCKQTLNPLISNLIWSAKESTLKVIKQGLRMDTRSVNTFKCEPGNTQNWQPLEIELNKSKKYFGWWKTMEGFVLTIVTEKKALRP